MKYKIILFGLVAALFTGCSSTYKAGQTPDDVYFSPAREASVAKETRNEDRYEDYAGSEEDRYLRMKIRDRQRWSSLDDYAYWNDSRYVPSFSYDYYRNNWYNSYSWNNWNSPFYSPYSFSYGGLGFHNYYSPWGYSPYTNVYITKYPTKVQQSVNRPSLNGYNNRNYNNSNGVNRQGSLGNAIKRVLTTPENNNYSNRNSRSSNSDNNTYKAPERTYTPSSSGSSSRSSSSGSSGGGVSRPPRN